MGQREGPACTAGVGEWAVASWSVAPADAVCGIRRRDHLEGLAAPQVVRVLAPPGRFSQSSSLGASSGLSGIEPPGEYATSLSSITGDTALRMAAGGTPLRREKWLSTVMREFRQKTKASNYKPTLFHVRDAIEFSRTKHLEPR